MQTYAETFLENFHAKYPGCTPYALGWGDTETGISSYKALLEKIASVRGPILDLACGDGHLLAQMISQGRNPRSLVGLDMSQGELNLAMTNPALAGVELVNGNARRMPFESERFSAVTCHMALMLMPRVHEILGEVARVLQPDGVFTAFINRKGDPCATREIYAEVMSEHVSIEQQMAMKRLADSRLSSPFEIEAIMDEHFHSLDVEDGELKFKGTPDEVIKCFMNMYYSYFITPSQMDKMRNDLLREFSKIADSNGHVTHLMPYRLITARKRQSN